MNDNDGARITDAKLLMAMQAVNPPLEKLMADRLALRHEVARMSAALAEAAARANNERRLGETQIPRFIAAAKSCTLVAATCALLALGTALFSDLIDLKLPTTLFASLLLPLWLVDMAERRFGRWEFKRGATFQYERRSCEA